MDAMIICPHCHTENRDGAQFCRQCGQRLAQPEGATANSHPCPYCGAAIRAGARFCKQCGRSVAMIRTSTNAAQRRCPSCGMALRPEARFCHQCGTSLPGAHPSVPTCPQCGTPLRPGARFCKQCGTAVEIAQVNINSHAGSSDPFQGPSPPPSYASANKPLYSSTGHLLPQQKIQGRYLIVQQIAEGGMGAIYLALDRRLDDKTIALKEMSEQKIPLEEREKVLKSFDQEAELLASLRHPNLTRVTDRFEEHGRHYMVMEFIEGKTLDELLDNQIEPFSEAQVLQWAAQLCEVLSFLHSQKPRPIIYRDIKPGNIMVVNDTDQVKLIDFGIARFYKRGKNKDTIPFGTEGYAPPEQYGKAQTDARADVYALGATLHELLTLEEPGSNLMNLPRVRKRNPDISERVADAIDKAVELNKNDRHQSMAEMWEALSGEAPQWPHLAPTAEDETEDALPTPSDDRVGVVDPDLQRISEPKPVYGTIIPDQTYVNLTHTFHFEPGETLRLSNSADWLSLSATKVDTQGGNVTLTIETHRLQPDYLEIRGNVLQRWLGWHTSRWVMTEREYITEVTIRSASGHKQSYPVIVHVAPTTWQQAVGWMRTLTAMLVEVGAAGGVLASLAYAAGLL